MSDLLEAALRALRVQETAELEHSNCPDCEGLDDWAKCGRCSEFFGTAIELRREVLTAALSLPDVGGEPRGEAVAWRAPKHCGLCIDCDGKGLYPSGAKCKSCLGTGLVDANDGEALATPPAQPAREAIPRLTSEGDALPTESILHPLADREKSADNLMDQARDKRRHAAALITDAEALEQLAYDTAEYCGGGEP